MTFAPPAGWPRISSSLVYDEPKKAIDFLCKAFGFELKLLVEHDGIVAHSQLVMDGGLIMVGGPDEKSRAWRKSPHAVGGANTQALMVFVPDVEAHFAHAKKAGAKIVTEPKTNDYGEEYWADRSYECEDLEGHHWYFVQRIRDPKKQG
jgi:uncharacterized glyoxalase superfamily protein PhnB